jgi:integrase/recombinase XerC
VDKKIRGLLGGFEGYMLEEKGNAETTAEDYIREVENFIDYNGYIYEDIINGDIDRIAIEEYLNSVNQGNLPKTRNKKMYALKKFFFFLSRKNYISENPTLELEGTKEEKNTKPIYLNKKELRRYMKVVDSDQGRNHKRNQALIYFMIFSGLRASEVTNIKIKEFDFENDSLTFVGKGKKQRTVPLNKKAKEKILEYMETERAKNDFTVEGSPKLFISGSGRGICKKTINRTIDKYLKKTDIEKKIRAHSLRHTFGYLFYSQTKDIKALQEILGHSNISTTQIYIHLDNEGKKKQVNSLTF